MTNVRALGAVVYGACLLVGATGVGVAAATPTPKPSASPHASVSPHARVTIPPVHLPGEKLHTEYVVEVNKKGQVVRVKSGKGTKNTIFNTQTYGNALQMWIRKPDGTAVVGLYKVTYDYDPKNAKVSRNISLVSTGGDWGDQPGAASVMIDTARKEALEAQKHASQSLPSLNTITGKPTPPPSPSPSPLPH